MEHDERGPTIAHIGRAADAVASDIHKLLTYAALVRRDLAHGFTRPEDAETLRLAGRQLTDRANHLVKLTDKLATVSG